MKCVNCEHDNAQHNDDIGCGGIYCDCPMNGSVDLGMTDSKIRMRCGSEAAEGVTCTRWVNHGGVHVNGDRSWLYTTPTPDRGPCEAVTVSLDGTREYTCNLWGPHGGPHRVGDFCWTDDYKPRCQSRFTQLGAAIRCEGDQGHRTVHKAGDSYWEDDDALVAFPYVDAVGSTQVGGNHYQETPIQPWAVIDAWGLDFYAGSALKYLYRAGRKGPKLEDLKKLRHYVDKLIELEESDG